jgi:peptidyl-prolyl cis-trans isomerase A (cyclophilin A)
MPSTPSRPFNACLRFLLLLALSLLAQAALARDLLVSSRFSSTVLRFDGDSGAFKSVFATGHGLANPNGIAYGPDGNLYAGNGDEGRVLVFDGQSGAYLRDFVTPETSGGNAGNRAIAFLPDGDLLVDSGATSQILRYQAGTGTFKGVFASGGGMTGPVGLTVAPDGKVYVGAALSNRVYVYDSAGALLRTLAPPSGQSNCTGVLIDPAGGLLVALSVTNTVLRMDAVTGAATTFASGGGLNIPINLIFHPSGDLLVGSFVNDKVIRYNGTTGQVIGDFIASGAGGLDGTHNFAFVPDPVVPNPVNTRVLLETDRGPLLLELDAAHAPNTVANFLSYVDAGSYDGTLFDQVMTGIAVHGGSVRADGSPVPRQAAIASERNNGLSNTAGAVAMALTGDPVNPNSATSAFFINTGANPSLDTSFTVFARVVFGLQTLAEINGTPIAAGSSAPIRPPLVKRAVRVAATEFPILPLHTGTWYDPANSGKGFLLEVANAGGSETGPILVVSWYDFFNGRQIWLVGIAPFAWGASSVEVPLQISEGGQFGSAFNAAQVTSNPNWGRITVRFSGCDAGSFSYTSIYGNGTIPVRSLTLPTDQRCSGQ